MIDTEKTNDVIEEGYKLSPSGELIPDYDTNIKYFDEGDLIEGVVIKIDRDEVLVDVGYKSEGVIPLKELSIKSNANPKDLLEEGQEILALVIQKEDNEGRLILSKKRADYEKAWEDIEDANKEGKVIGGRVIEIVKGGLILDVGVRGFLPASLIEMNRVKNLDQYVNQDLECKIIEVNRSRNNVVLSRKAVLNNDQRNEKQKVLEDLEKGQLVTGVISSIVDFGAFVDLGGVDGLIHISELSWEHINHPSEIVSLGLEVEVQVLEIDNKKSRVSLGLKQTSQDPWKEKLADHEIGQIVKGKVSKILPFGVFIEFGELEGLIHISELAPGRILDPKEVVEIGQDVEAKLIGIDESRRRISLSIKQTQESPSSEAAAETTDESAEKKPKSKLKTEKAQAKSTKTAAQKEKTTVETAHEDSSSEENTDEEEDVAAKQTETTEEVISESVETEEKGTKRKTKKSKVTKEDEALLEKLAHGPTKIEDKAISDVPNANSLEDVLEQMKKSHGVKK